VNIALISPSLLETPPIFGGAIETFTYELGLNLAKLHNEVIILSRKWQSNKIKIDSNITIIPLKAPDFSLLRGMYYNFEIYRTLLKKKLIDMLHTQGTAVFPSAYLISKHLNIPLVHTEHVYYPWISTSHVDNVKKVKYPLEISLGKFCLTHANQIVVANQYMKRAIQSIHQGLEKKIAIIPQGIDEKRFNPNLNKEYIRKKYNFSKTDKIILYVGRISPEKNLELLIKTFHLLKKEYDNLKLFLVGPKTSRFPSSKQLKTSQYFLKLEKWIQKNDLTGSIIFSGPVAYRKIPYYYVGCDLFIQPSPFETFGRAIFEAAAAGLPFICTQIGNKIPQYLPKSSGIFLKQLSGSELERAIKRILDNENEFKKWGLQAANQIGRYYSWRKIAKKYLKIYKEIIKN